MNNNIISILNDYRDKSYVSNILCQSSADYYGYISSIISIPLILLSSVMTILNSSDIPASDMKISNIVINGTTVLILSLSNNFKVNEKISNFKSIAIKYNKLCHHIEDILNLSIDTVNNEQVREIIKMYDDTTEQIDFTFPYHIKERIKKTYCGKRKLPNVLNCTEDFSSKINSPCIKPMSSLVFKNNLPRVIDVKMTSNFNEEYLNECV